MSNTPTAQRASTVGQGRTHTSLRDHLNERVAPYLKKALIEGLKHDVEYPLQWLGEHLIYLSTIYESNPDSTGIRERFRYDHDAAPPQAQLQPQDTMIKTEEEGGTESTETQPQIPEQDSTMSNGIGGTEEAQTTNVNDTTSPSQQDSTSSATAAVEMTGSTTLSSPRPQPGPTVEDTEMGGAE